MTLRASSPCAGGASRPKAVPPWRLYWKRLVFATTPPWETRQPAEPESQGEWFCCFFPWVDGQSPVRALLTVSKLTFLLNGHRCTGGILPAASRCVLLVVRSRHTGKCFFSLGRTRSYDATGRVHPVYARLPASNFDIVYGNQGTAEILRAASLLLGSCVHDARGRCEVFTTLFALGASLLQKAHRAVVTSTCVVCGLDAFSAHALVAAFDAVFSVLSRAVLTPWPQTIQRRGDSRRRSVSWLRRKRCEGHRPATCVSMLLGGAVY